MVESRGKVSLDLSTKKIVNNGGERLKPPPSCINTGRKTIKLNNAANTSADLNFHVIKKNGSESEIKESSHKQELLQEKRKSMNEPTTGTKKLKVYDNKNQVAHLVSIHSFTLIFYCTLLVPIILRIK